MPELTPQTPASTNIDPGTSRRSISTGSHSTMKIVILGGGESAWMAAAYLSAAIPRELVSITVVSDGTAAWEFPGESHQPSFFRLLSNLGVTEEELLRRCDGVYEFGTDYRTGLDKYFVAASEAIPVLQSRRIAELCSETLAGRLHELLPQAAAAFRHRAPGRFLGTSELQKSGAYRLSFDSRLFALMLRESSLRRGVSEVRSSLISMVHRDDGSISHVGTTSPAGNIDCDLVLCCSEEFRKQYSNEEMLTFGQCEDSPFHHVSTCHAIVDAMPPSFSQFVLQPSDFSCIRWLRSGFACHRFTSDSQTRGEALSLDPDLQTIVRDFLQIDAINLSESVSRESVVGCCRTMWHRNLVFVGAGAMVTDPVAHAGRHLCQTACELLLDYLTAAPQSYPVIAREYHRRLYDAYESWSSMARYTRDLLFGRCGSDSHSHFASLRIPSGASEQDLFCLQAAFQKFPKDRRLNSRAVHVSEQHTLEAELREMTENMVGNLPGHSEYLDWIHGVKHRRTA